MEMLDTDQLLAWLREEIKLVSESLNRTEIGSKAYYVSRGRRDALVEILTRIKNDLVGTSLKERK